MKFHRIIVLLIGWYLLAAPLPSETMRYDLSAPLKQWQHLESFDNATECENRLSEMQKILSKSGPYILTLTQGKASQAFTVPADLRPSTSVCVASDDVRLH